MSQNRDSKYLRIEWSVIIWEKLLQNMEFQSVLLINTGIRVSSAGETIADVQCECGNIRHKNAETWENKLTSKFPNTGENHIF